MRAIYLRNNSSTQSNPIRHCLILLVADVGVQGRAGEGEKWPVIETGISWFSATTGASAASAQIFQRRPVRSGDPLFNPHILRHRSFRRRLLCRLLVQRINH